MVLRGLQSLIGRLYDVELRYDVYDFLVTDRRAVAATGPRTTTASNEEELLLAEGQDAGGNGAAGVALYLDPQLLSRLEKADPHRALTDSNLADYCTALEGGQSLRLLDLAPGIRSPGVVGWSSKHRRKSTNTPSPSLFAGPRSRAADIPPRSIRVCSTG